MNRIIEFLNLLAQMGFAHPLERDEGAKGEGEKNEQVLQEDFHAGFNTTNTVSVKP